MRNITRLVAVAGVLATGCPSGEGGPGPTSSVSSTPTGAQTAPPIPEGMVGVASCDAYVTKMKSCIDKMPETERDARRKALDGSLATFREQAARPDTKANLETTCKAAMQALESDPLCK